MAGGPPRTVAVVPLLLAFALGACGDSDGTVEASREEPEVDSSAPTAMDAPEPAPDDALDSAVLRHGAVVDDELWFAGGLQGSPGQWMSNPTITRLSRTGEILEETALDLPPGRFLYARWIGRLDGGVAAVGALCAVPAQTPHCPVTDTEGTVVVVSISGRPEMATFPDIVVPMQPGVENVTPESVAILGDSALVVALESGPAVDSGLVPTARVHPYLINRTDGTSSELPGLEGLTSAEALCSIGTRLYAAAPSVSGDSTRMTSLHLSELELGGDAREARWQSLGDVPIDEPYAGGGVQLECSPWGEVYAFAFGEATTAVQVFDGRSVQDGHRVRFSGAIRSIDVEPGALLVSSVSSAGLTVQRVRKGGSLETVASDAEYLESDARVLDVGGTLVNLLPAIRYDSGSDELFTSVPS